MDEIKVLEADPDVRMISTQKTGYGYELVYDYCQHARFVEIELVDIIPILDKHPNWGLYTCELGALQIKSRNCWPTQDFEG